MKYPATVRDGVYDTILLATDGSDPARAATAHAGRVAEAFDATVHVCSVGSDDASAAVADATERLDGVRTETIVREGNPAPEILAAADEVGAGLIAAGTQGRRGLRRAVAGSVAERIVRRAEVPVMTVREGDDPASYERVLLPTDGSSDAERAVEPATTLAAAFDAAIHVVSVIDVNTVAAQSELANPSVITNDLRDRSERATERVARRVDEAGLSGTATVLQGTPSEAILNYAADESCDLITMATHGRTGLERVLIGSTTERTIRRASIPVVSVGHDRDWVSPRSSPACRSTTASRPP